MEPDADPLGVQRRRRALLTLSARHLTELVAEIAPLVQGATLSELVALPPRDLVLFFKDPVPAGAPTTVSVSGLPVSVRRVHVSADGDQPRLYLQTARQRRPEGPVGPFFRRVAEELAGARLRRIEQVARDRIVVFEFDQTPRGERRALVAELVGRHSNLALLGANERVLDVLVPPPEGSRNAPRLALGAVWQPPPGAPKPGEGAGLEETLGEPSPEPSENRPDPRAPLSFLVQERLGREVAELALQRARRSLVERTERKLARARSLEHGLTQRLSASDQAESVRLDGEALNASFHLLERGAREVVVPDPYSEDGATRTIALDPRRGPRENVEHLFERYKKLVRARETVERELAGAREKVADLERLLAEAQLADQPEALEGRAVERGLLEPPQEPDERKRKDEPRKPYHVFAGGHGSEIRVGRSAKDNDELSFRHSRGNDVWLHTAEAPGSHVVLRVERNVEPDDEEVLDAAHLAVHFSPLRGATRANVHVARCKDVHKPRGAKPGLVTLSAGKVLSVRMQPQRLQRLLDRSRGAGS